MYLDSMSYLFHSHSTKCAEGISQNKHHLEDPIRKKVDARYCTASSTLGPSRQDNAMTHPLGSQFIYVTCQVGAEAIIKKEVASVGWRLAFSRPGFLTFKLSEVQPISAFLEMPSIFIRSWGLSLGKVGPTAPEQLAVDVWKLLGEHPLDRLHVWPRDRAAPGHKGFEPRMTDESTAAERLLCATAPEHYSKLVATTNASSLAQRNEHVLDCILVDPGQWWIGAHQVNRRVQRWPGGIWSCNRPTATASRAYLKMCEALDWTCWPMKPGQRCVELGCSPGGSSQALLERGLRVVGVDPAEVDPRVILGSNPLWPGAARSRGQTCNRSSGCSPRSFQTSTASCSGAVGPTLPRESPQERIKMLGISRKAEIGCTSDSLNVKNPGREKARRQPTEATSFLMIASAPTWQVT